MWTKKAPDKPGYYWIMDVPNDDELRVVQIYESLVGPMVENDESELHVSPPSELDVHMWWSEPLEVPAPEGQEQDDE